MTGHLARLALQATRPGTSGSGGLRPRTPSLFERPSSLAPGEYAEPPAVARTSLEEPSRVAARADPEVTPDPGRRRPARPEEPRPVTDIPSSTDSRGTAGEPARTDPAFRAGAPGTDAEETPQGTPRHTRTPDFAPAARSEPSSVGTPNLLDAVTEAVTDRVAQVVGPAAATTRASVSAPAEDHGDSPGVPEHSPAASATRGAEPGFAHGQAPTTAEHRIRAARPLPRLTPAPRDDASQPEVTVNIGRIEVVQPATPERKPLPARPRTNDSGAPGLADYLRDRSRR